ncbi:MAG: hypothetical protein HKN44_03390 [Ilumatobacter sp.]|nr:hypothetical protein [Ilumatobacter sp.]
MSYTRFIRSGLLAVGLVIGGSLVGSALAAPPVNDEAGALAKAGPKSSYVPIESYRAYDSRNALPTLDVPPDQRVPKLGQGYVQPVRVATNEVSFQQISVPQIPATATAVTYNLTVDQTEGAGFITLAGTHEAAAAQQTAAVNWTTSGQTVGNGGSVLLGTAGDVPGFMTPGWVHLTVGGTPGARAHVIIDITGYYEP